MIPIMNWVKIIFSRLIKAQEDKARFYIKNRIHYM